MGKYIDFVVEWSDDPEEMGHRILQNLTVNRIKAKKPTVIGITGGSSEGKSYTALKIAEIVNDYFGVDTAEVIDDIVAYTPLEYTRKIEKLLFDNSLRNVHTFIIDEGRELIKAKLWHSFIMQAIADVSAMHRQVKPLVLLVVSQDLADILKDVRRLLTYYGKCVRPIRHNVQFTLFKLWKDERDLENVKLRKRLIRGHAIKDGRKVVIIVKKFTVKMPRKEVVKRYEELSFERKAMIIRMKLEKLLKEIQRELGYDKIEALVKYYCENLDQLHMILERKDGKVKLKKEAKEILDLSSAELKEFERRLLEGLAEMGFPVYGK